MEVSISCSAEIVGALPPCGGCPLGHLSNRPAHEQLEQLARLLLYMTHIAEGDLDWGRTFPADGPQCLHSFPLDSKPACLQEKVQVPSSHSGLFQLGSEICKYTTVNRQVCKLFLNCHLNKGIFPTAKEHDRAIKITTTHVGVSLSFTCLIAHKQILHLKMHIDASMVSPHH